MNEIVIWAHSECRSTMSLFREVKRQAGVPVTIALWQYGDTAEIRAKREAAGQAEGEYDDLAPVPVGEDLARGEELLAMHSGEGAVHVFCVYQNSAVWRRLILLAKKLGLRVVVYAEAPCEMCLGPKAWMKRLYYRFVLPFRLREVAQAADLFICQSGRIGVERLTRLGWAKEKIVPFGYASAVFSGFPVRDYEKIDTRPFHVLHTGVETPYRSVETLLKAERILKRHGIKIEVVRTHGTLPVGEMERLYKWADVSVACGLCEPWGMRVVDAIHAGLPVIVSDGMGVEWMVEKFGCGSIYKKGNARELADLLERFSKDVEFRSRLTAGVSAAHEAWLPENRAKDFLELLSR